MKYQAHVGNRVFDIHRRDGVLEVNGETLPCSFEPISGGFYSLIIAGKSLSIAIEPTSDGRLHATLHGRHIDVRVKDEKALLLERFGMSDAADAADREIRAPMPGLVLSVQVRPGDAVKAGDGLVVLEAMKMENELRAPNDGIVHQVHTAPQEAVVKNQLLIELEK